MRISSITFNVYNTKNPREVKNTHYVTPALPVDSVSFTGVRHAEIMQKLYPYKIPDMYSGRIMLAPKILERMQKSKIFSEPISTVIEVLNRYESSLCPVPEKLFYMIKQIALENPNITLEGAMKMLFEEHNKKLLKSQQIIFEKLIKEACKMPEDLFEEFLELMNLTNKKLTKSPIIMYFNPKEFIYKLNRISLEIKSRNNYREVATIKKIIRMSKFYLKESKYQNQEQSFKFGTNRKNIRRLFKFLKIKSNQNHTKLSKEKIQKQIIKFSILRDFLNNSALKNNKELQELFADASARIHGLPVIIPFQRKPFIHDLEKITDKLEDTKLAHHLVKIACNLPRAREDVSAFIVKTASNSYSSEKIGYDLLSGSICSIEHLIPKSKGGKDDISNYGLASAYTNSERSNVGFTCQLRIHPETYENCQKYVNRLIELCNAGIFKKIEFPRSYIEQFAAKIKKLSPKENPLILDLSKLKTDNI